MLCSTLASSLTWVPNTWECGWRLPSWTATEEQNYFILFSINLKLKETHVVRNSEELITSWPSVNSWLPTVLRLCYLEKQAVGQTRPRAGFHWPWPHSVNAWRLWALFGTSAPAVLSFPRLSTSFWRTIAQKLPWGRVRWWTGKAQPTTTESWIEFLCLIFNFFNLYQWIV